jgi:hypothetical protein
MLFCTSYKIDRPNITYIAHCHTTYRAAKMQRQQHPATVQQALVHAQMAAAARPTAAGPKLPKKRMAGAPVCVFVFCVNGFGLDWQRETEKQGKPF